MGKLFLAALLLWGNLFAQAQDTLTCRNASISFFSSAPIEDIEARTSEGLSALNRKEKTIYFKVPIKSFQFRKSLMQEHFNEDYLESDKYPYAEFDGRILSAADLGNDGVYTVTIQGTLTMHGVARQYQVTGTLKTAGNGVQASSTFKVRLADHNIKIPALLFHNIAEVVDVKINATYL